jgi:hypothetical protein
MSLDELLSAYDGTDAELRLMIEQRSQLADLMGSPGWKVFQSAVYSRLAPIQKRMMTGGGDRYKTGGFEAYQRDVGFVLGMTEAVDGTLAKVEAMIQARLQAGSDLPDDYPDGNPES